MVRPDLILSDFNKVESFKYILRRRCTSATCGLWPTPSSCSSGGASRQIFTTFRVRACRVFVSEFTLCCCFVLLLLAQNPWSHGRTRRDRYWVNVLSVTSASRFLKAPRTSSTRPTAAPWCAITANECFHRSHLTYGGMWSSSQVPRTSSTRPTTASWFIAAGTRRTGTRRKCRSWQVSSYSIRVALIHFGFSGRGARGTGIRQRCRCC